MRGARGAATVVYAICGCPRSGTTWLHNALIAAGRFRGVPGDDAANASRHILVTDENQYSHAYLLRLAARGRRASLLPSRTLLAVLRRALSARFAAGGDMMLKSPYYCFFVDLMYEQEFAQKFIYIRRNIDRVALSMLNHPVLRPQIEGGIDRFSSMMYRHRNFETRFVPPGIDEEFRQRYRGLTPFDRAMFKCLCFASSFAALQTGIPPASILIVSYDSLRSEAAEQDRLGEFLRLDSGQRESLVASFRGGDASPRDLPAHDAEFRSRMLAAEAALWTAGLAQRS